MRKASSAGKKARRKGHNLERKISSWCRKVLGYKLTKTSRQASKLLDDCGVDICFDPTFNNMPFLIQCKAGYNRNRIKPDIEIKKIRERLLENFNANDEIHNKPIIIMNKLDGRSNDDFIVSMNFKDFEKLLLNEFEI